jgi:hypothetical protein
MRKTLMTTVAAAALVGFTAMAAAQTTEGQPKAAAKPAGATQEQKGATGGAMTHQPSAAQSTEKTPATSTEHSAQGAEPAAKPEQRMGKDEKSETTPQRGAQQERNTQDKGTEQKGAQDERGTQQHGAQEETGKSGVNGSEQHASQKPDSSKASHGASVQLSQTQRTKIQSVIGKSSEARATTDVKFDVSVGARVPRDVHFEVLPRDVVEIVPQYEGFDYVVVGDNILIIDPDSLEIVAVIQA